MKKTIQVRNITLGEGKPKICVPIVGRNDVELIEEIAEVKKLGIDLVEWRIDYYERIDSMEMIKAMLLQMRNLLGDTPLLVTFRSKREGGEKSISTEYYIQLNKEIAATKLADMIDVELLTGDQAVEEITSYAHKQDVFVVMSNHEFYRTPDKGEIVRVLCKMQRLDADIPKIAVMPQSIDDVLTLLSATNEMIKNYADRPIITMSMSGLGVVSRLSGELFGSAVTFGAAKTASAPGQISVQKLNEILEIIHEAL